MALRGVDAPPSIGTIGPRRRQPRWTGAPSNQTDAGRGLASPVDEEPRDELMRPSAAPSRPRTALLAVAAFLLVTLVAGCGMLPPDPKTEAAKTVWDLYLIVFIMGATVFVGVEAFIVFAVLRYRRRDDHLPDQLHGNNMIEMIWTAIPTVIVLVLFVLASIALGAVEARTDHPAVTIEVDGFQWQWEFRYLDGDTDPSNDVVVKGSPADPPVMTLPIDEPVRLILRSRDVIHSFYVPHFLIKRDLIPVPEDESLNELELSVTEVGTYGGQCAEFCGDLHARMTFSVQAMTRADYDAWLAAAPHGPPSPPPSASLAPDATVDDLTADRIAFDTRELTAPAGEAFAIRFTNEEDVVHNVAIFRGEERIFTGDPITGPGATIDYVIPPLPPGEYTFQCDYHPVPDMTGTLTVE
ncbi:MAG TPA: cytochrome c oxidase subunit II [Candidatus Limnocylindria bacterium]